MANVSVSSTEEEDNVFSSQFAALLKPIRELTAKHACWEVNIAEKLDEYVHYIAHLSLEVNVNGQQVKLDFAKAAMVVQNSVQIYSKKVEDLWLLLQEVMDALSSHSNNGDNNEEGQNPTAARLKRASRRRHQKGDVDLLEAVPLKFRKSGSKIKRKTAIKEPKKMQTVPYEILQLEEAVNSSNPVKIRLYTLSHEHLGYPSDLRSNFPFDPCTFFLKIDHCASLNTNPETPQTQDDDQPEPGVERLEPAQDGPADSDGLDDRPPDLDVDWQNDDDGRAVSDTDHVAPAEPDSHRTVEMLAEKNMRLRPRPELRPILADQEDAVVLNDPWRGMDPYSDDESIKKPCGPPTKCRLPEPLRKERKRKQVGKDPIDNKSIIGIDEYLGKSHFGAVNNKKLQLKNCRPDNEFWEDFVHFSKTTGSLIKKQLRQRPGAVGEEDKEDDSVDHEEDRKSNDDRNDEDDDGPCREAAPASPDFGGMNDDDFQFDGIAGSPSHSPHSDLDESKQFFHLVQQFMAEYTASAQNFVQQTESTKRVQAWHEMIQPRLLEAESRRDFDIHQYGSRILDTFGAEAPLGSRTTFAQIVSSKPKNEVARYFLAALQLANTYNVEIGPQGDLDMDGVELSLVSRERHHEHMDDFV